MQIKSAPFVFPEKPISLVEHRCCRGNAAVLGAAFGLLEGNCEARSMNEHEGSAICTTVVPGGFSFFFVPVSCILFPMQPYADKKTHTPPKPTMLTRLLSVDNTKRHTVSTIVFFSTPWRMCCLSCVVSTPPPPWLVPRQIFNRFMENDNFNDGAGGYGPRDVLLALAEAIVGAESVASLSSAVALLASVNDVANGKLPRESTIGDGRGELQADDIDFW